MNDVIVEQIRRIREQLINRHGGIDGYFKHCQAQERAWAARSKLARWVLRQFKPTARIETKRLLCREPLTTRLNVLPAAHISPARRRLPYASTRCWPA